MTEAEALDLIVGFGANATSGFAIYISFTFAFLTLSYFVGSKLTTFQAIVVSVIYIIGAIGPAVSACSHIRAIAEKFKSHLDEFEYLDRLAPLITGRVPQGHLQLTLRGLQGLATMARLPTCHRGRSPLVLLPSGPRSSCI